MLRMKKLLGARMCRRTIVVAMEIILLSDWLRFREFSAWNLRKSSNRSYIDSHLMCSKMTHVRYIIFSASSSFQCSSFSMWLRHSICCRKQYQRWYWYCNLYPSRKIKWKRVTMDTYLRHKWSMWVSTVIYVCRDQPWIHFIFQQQVCRWEKAVD